MTKYILAWDLGATKCIAGIVKYDIEANDFTCVNKCKIRLSDTTCLEDLIQQIEHSLNFTHKDADCICIAGAGFYDGQYLLHENAYPYEMHFAKVALEKAWPNYAVIHDYAPIVCATFTSYMQQINNLKYLNANPLKPYGRRVALGIGTGLGMKDGVLFENGEFWLGQNEVGHTGISHPPSADKYHRQLHQELIKYFYAREEESKQNNAINNDKDNHKNNHKNDNWVLNYEKILTGQGTVNLYQFFYPQDKKITPEEVGIKMREGKVSEMVKTFAWYAGLFVGTVQLTFMPDGGIWITGGVAINHLEVFDLPDFKNGISASPAYWTQRESFPLGVMCNPEHALIGCSFYAVKRLLRVEPDIGYTMSVGSMRERARAIEGNG